MWWSKFAANKRRNTSNLSQGSTVRDTFEDLFSDPVVPNQTFPSAKKKVKPKSATSKKPRKSENWSPIPLAAIRGLRNDRLKFKSRRNKENMMSETAPVEVRLSKLFAFSSFFLQKTVNTRRSGDSAWRTRTIGLTENASPSKTRTLVKGGASETRTILRGRDELDSPSKTRTLVRGSEKTRTIYRARDDPERTSPSKTRTLVKAGEENLTIVKGKVC